MATGLVVPCNAKGRARRNGNCGQRSGARPLGRGGSNSSVSLGRSSGRGVTATRQPSKLESPVRSRSPGSPQGGGVNSSTWRAPNPQIRARIPASLLFRGMKSKPWRRRLVTPEKAGATPVIPVARSRREVTFLGRPTASSPMGERVAPAGFCRPTLGSLAKALRPDHGWHFRWVTASRVRGAARRGDPRHCRALCDGTEPCL